MSEDSGISKYLTDSMVWLLDEIANGRGPKVMGYIVFGVLVTLWLYCGVKIYFDAKDRFHSSNATKYVFLVFGLITGPLGLILYTYTKPKYTPDEMEFIRVEHKFYYFQAAKVLDCIKCNSYVLEGQMHCTNCGTQNRFRCEKCNKLTDYDALYCPACGVHLKEFLTQKRLEVHPVYTPTTAPRRTRTELSPVVRNFVSQAKPKAEKMISNLTTITKSVATKINDNMGKKKPLQPDPQPAPASPKINEKKKAKS
jgi:predicted RNA-binding Zn-ribbon protein involved in translation (DUF1610 family)